MYFFLKTAEKFRVDIDKVWKEEIWPKASNIAEIIGTNLSAPRRVPLQTMRSNVAGSAEDYFKISIGINMLDFINSDLKT